MVLPSLDLQSVILSWPWLLTGPDPSSVLWPTWLQVQLILPEALKLLPLYSLALHKSNMLRPDVRADDRSSWLAGIVSASPQRTMGLLHPRLFAVHNLLVSVWTPLLHTWLTACRYY